MTDFDIAKPGPLMAGKRGLVMGVANDRSIAWGIARVLAGQGAELAFTYQGGAFGRRALPLAQSLGSKIIEECNVLDLPSVDNVFSRIEKEWGGLDFVVHALAYSDPKELGGRYADTTRENFINHAIRFLRYYNFDGIDLGWLYSKNLIFNYTYFEIKINQISLEDL